MTVELKRHEVRTLISLVTLELDRLGKEKERYGCDDPSYFYKLVDIRNKLMAMPLAEEPTPSISDEEWQGFLKGKGVG